MPGKTFPKEGDRTTPTKAPDATRKDERLELPTEILLSKVGPDGVSEKAERTIAHALSRSGMRLLTSWGDLAENDHVAIQEVGGTFSTGKVPTLLRAAQRELEALAALNQPAKR